ncbi:MAG: hypothetical protein JW737_00925 [Acidobacteria bacterium]|nr:hypothetical protein [Acidobacteriota bacterium]
MRVISVKTYDGHKAAVKPKSIIVDNDELLVLDILYKTIEEDFQSRAQKEKYILRCEDLKVYYVTHMLADGIWYLDRVE